MWPCFSSQYCTEETCMDYFSELLNIRADKSNKWKTVFLALFLEKHSLDLICCYSWGSRCAPFSCILKWLLAFCKAFPEPASFMSLSCKWIILYFSIKPVKAVIPGNFCYTTPGPSSELLDAVKQQACSLSVHLYQLTLTENS